MQSELTTEDKCRMNAQIMCECYYFNYYKQYRPIGCRNFTNKYLKYFIKASEMFCIRENFEPRSFIKSVLAEGFIFPNQVPVEKNWKIFQRNSLEYKEEEKKETPGVALAHRVVNTFVYLNVRTIKQLTENYFTKQDLINDYANDNIDLCVYSFSKAFKEFAKQEKMLIDFKEEQKEIKRYPKIYAVVKAKLGDDFEEEKS